MSGQLPNSTRKALDALNYPSRAEIIETREKMLRIWKGGTDCAVIILQPFISQARKIAADDDDAALQLECLGHRLGRTIERGVKRSRSGPHRWPRGIRPEARAAIPVIIDGVHCMMEHHPEPEERYRRRFAGEALERVFWPEHGEKQERVRAMGWLWFLLRPSGPAWADWEKLIQGDYPEADPAPPPRPKPQPPAPFRLDDDIPF